MKLLTILVCVATLLSAQADRIIGERIRPHVKFLASDLLEGRGPGTRGGLLAQEYIAAQFAAAGLEPAGDNGDFTIFGLDATTELRWLDDFVATTHRRQTSLDFEAQMVFVGHGIRAAEFAWDDYRGVDVKGKVVVLFTGEPPSDDPKFFAGKALTYYGRWTYKFEEAARQGALGAIIIHTTPTASYGWQVVRGQGRPMPQATLPPDTPALALAGWITSESGGKLLGSSNLTLADALAAADKRGFRPRLLSAKLRVKLDFRIAPIDTGNVIGKATGSDPRLKDEAVIFTAHWDHLGIGAPVNGDSIYNGAIDNATGSAMLIEMARAWASQDPKPKRSAYFAAVTAEESGLLGSKYLAEHPPAPPAHITADLNLDSFSPIGRTRDAGFAGAERTTLWQLVQQTASEFGLTLKQDTHPEAGGYFRSDHFSFARTGVPAFSVGMGGDFVDVPAVVAAEKGKLYGSRYHQPSDEYSADWDFSGMEQFARLGFTLGVRIANLDHVPTWQAGDEFLPARQASGVH